VETNKPLTSEHATQAGHWYSKTGEPAYTIVGKNGKERNTTLRDARTLGLLPSVTSIIRLAASPSLENWKAEQLLLAAMTTTRQEGETEEGFIAHIKESARAQSEKARENGTRIHALVQSGFEGKPFADDGSDKYYLSARNSLFFDINKDVIWECEKSFATSRYGGKIDLICDEYIIDFKTTSNPLDGIKLWDDHYLQLAAYDVESRHKCGILYINVDTAESKLIWATEDELKRGKKMFDCLCDYFYAKSGL
jgi:hypothetical protein